MSQDTEMRRVRGFGDTTFVMLAREGLDAVTGRAALPEASMRFESAGASDGDWQVRAFTAVEGLSTVYECVVDLAHESLTANPDALLGAPAVLRVSRDALTRRFAGLVRRVEHRGTSATHRLAKVYVVPALWALSQRSDTRIFQDKTAVEVVEAVLREAGLYAGRLDVQVHRALAAREYCVQHRETDLDFVTRLLAEEGVAFHFRHDDDGETLVLSDGAHAWRALPTMDGGAVPVAGAETATLHVEAVRHLAWERSLRPSAVTVRDFDFTRPDLRIERSAPRRRDPARPLYEPGPEVTLGGYQTPAYADDDAHDQATLRLEAARCDGAVGAGQGAVTGMIPGALFQLSVAGSHVPEQRYVITRVEHEGVAPEEILQGTHEDRPSVDRYKNRFWCAPAEVPWRPARSVPRPVIAGIQTAIVVGPPGEEIYTDEHGRIRVQFHWDRLGARDAHSTCWLRVVQGPWSGGGWGFQFIPRVGMEVAVTFLDGDPDRPVVTGALYNGLSRPPYALPAERTRSGIRTSSTPGGGGSNELRFEDLAGSEEVYLHAQREHTVEVGRDESVTVQRDQRVSVLRDQVTRVQGAREVVVEGAQTSRVQGARADHVRGEFSTRVEGACSATVRGDASQQYDGELATRVGGVERREVVGASQQTHHGDVTTRVSGCHTTIVGQHDARRAAVLHVEGVAKTWGSVRTELGSDGEVMLRCGDSMIRVTPTRIELDAPTVSLRGRGSRLTLGDDRAQLVATSAATVRGDSVAVRGAGASVVLDGEATVRGGAIHLASPQSPERDEHVDREPPTIVELLDQRGDPVARARYVVTLADGSTLSGMLDERGRAEVALEESAEVTFPEVGGVEGARAQGGPMRPYVVRQGDYLTRLAHTMGFDADAAWGDARNEALRRRRTNMDVLAPGDVIYLPEPRRAGRSIAPHATNSYRARVATVTVRLTMRGDDGAPLANERYAVEGLGPRLTEGTTDGHGNLTFEAPVSAREVRLRFAEGRAVIPLQIGHMDPISERSGAPARLLNLGYLSALGGEGEGDGALFDALQRFQREHHLAPTGALDDATRDALQRAHGA